MPSDYTNPFRAALETLGSKLKNKPPVINVSSEPEDKSVEEQPEKPNPISVIDEFKTDEEVIKTKPVKKDRKKQSRPKKVKENKPVEKDDELDDNSNVIIDSNIKIIF